MVFLALIWLLFWAKLTGPGKAFPGLVAPNFPVNVMMVSLPNTPWSEFHSLQKLTMLYT